MFKVKCKIWFENDQGKPFFGDGRAELLYRIGQTGSLAQAARELKMSYRTAWQHLNDMEKSFGKKLLQRSSGGSRGGGSTLTPEGENLLNRYQTFRQNLDRDWDQHFKVLIEKSW